VTPPLLCIDVPAAGATSFRFEPRGMDPDWRLSGAYDRAGLPHRNRLSSLVQYSEQQLHYAQRHDQEQYRHDPPRAHEVWNPVSTRPHDQRIDLMGRDEKRI
jgi:hypothetical protein